MRLSTRTLASLLVLTAVAMATSSIPRTSGRKSQFDKILQRHDRKGELRAEILGMDSYLFRYEMRRRSFEEIIKAHGFADIRQFRIALFGKLRDELRQRGWTTRRIDNHLTSRIERSVG